MIIGFDFFQGQTFDANFQSGDIYRCEISNTKVDEIKIDTGNAVNFNPSKTSWGLNTILKCPFTDLILEAGNLTLAGMPIEYIRVKKRKTNDLNWGVYKDMPFNPNKTNYQWSDLFVQSLESYDYAVMPLGVQGIEGTYNIKSVDCNYEDIWILGTNDKQYHLFANIEKGDIQTVSPSSFVEVLGSRYPYEISNGEINFRQGSLKATLISDNTLISGGMVDRKSEKMLKDSLYNFLTNRKPKIYKDSDGDYILISIKMDSVKISPNNSSSRAICDILFDFIEIGDSNSVIDLQNAGLIE